MSLIILGGTIGGFSLFCLCCDLREKLRNSEHNREIFLRNAVEARQAVKSGNNAYQEAIGDTIGESPSISSSSFPKYHAFLAKSSHSVYWNQQNDANATESTLKSIIISHFLECAAFGSIGRQSYTGTVMCVHTHFLNEKMRLSTKEKLFTSTRQD